MADDPKPNDDPKGDRAFLDSITPERGISLGAIQVAKGMAIERRAEREATATAEPQVAIYRPLQPRELTWKETFSSWGKTIGDYTAKAANATLATVSNWLPGESPPPTGAAAVLVMPTEQPTAKSFFPPVDPSKANGTEYSAGPSLEAPAAPAIAAGANRAQIAEGFRTWLGENGTLPASYADRLLNDKDGSFRGQVVAMFEKQQDPDAVAYGRGFMKSVDTVKSQWDAAPRMDNNSPDARPTVDIAPKL